MKIAILSCSELAKQFYQMLRKTSSPYEALYIVEEVSELWGTFYEQAEIISVGKAVCLYQRNLIEKFVIVSMEERFNRIMYKILTMHKIPDNDILYADQEDIHEFKNESILFKYTERQEFDTIEFHVTDKCNLNCKHCSMFSGLVKESMLPDIRQYENDLKQIHSVFRSIKRFKLLGGEPLLNPELRQFIEVTRNIFPYTHILLITNGLLITSMNNELIDCIVKKNVEIVVSYYMPLNPVIDDIHRFLNSHHIRHRITPIITQFYKMYDLSGGQNADENFVACGCKEGCTTLRDGKLMSCFVPSIFHIAASAFHLAAENYNYIDLYQQDLSQTLIRETLMKKMDICKYCLVRGVATDWAQIDKNSIPQMQDWSI